MLNPSDVYVSGGPSDLLVCWTDKVTKYDASSFYNFEQDNLPLHDLDERTHLLWERLGNPTSGITGMSFIVSGDATSSCNPQYFTTLQSCLAAIPEVINFPILIEVASFGNLGDLHLANKVFGPEGSLEIVNRNSAFAGAVNLSANPMSVDQIDADFANYSIASAVSSVSSALDASAPSITFDLVNSMLYSTSQRSFVASSSPSRARHKDLRYSTEKQYAFTRRVGRDQLGVLTASLSSTVSGFDNTGNIQLASKRLFFDAYDKSFRTTDNMDSYDASTLNEIGNTYFYPPSNLASGIIAPQDAVAASVYYNHLNSIRVYNCNGPIYIRNFTVDGQKSKDKGIEILNSTVNLERCSASRCTKAGLYAANSNVNLLRGFVAFRNYGFENGTRIGQPYSEKITDYQSLSSYGAGIYAEDSTINFKSTYVRDVKKSEEASSLIYTSDNFPGGLPAPSQENLYCLSRNDIGIHARNSNIIGGRTELDGSATTAWADAVQIFSELNTEAGSRLSNCSLDIAGRFLLYGNYFGLDSKGSDLSFDYFKAYGNQKDGIKLSDSNFTYNNNTYEGFLASDYDSAKNNYLQHQVTLIKNGTALQAENSTITPVYTSGMPVVYESFMVSATHGAFEKGVNGETSNRVKPNVILDSSKLDAVHFSVYPDAHGNIDDACFGEAISARNGSRVTLRGSSKYANKIIGANLDEAQHKRVGVHATDNSVVSIQGPSVIAQFGIDALADNNSKLEICPPRDSNGNLLVSSFSLSDSANHTVAELHSTRSCIVADNGSVINLEDLGYYKNSWDRYAGLAPADPERLYGSAVPFSRLDYLRDEDGGTASYASSVSGGSLQFYPNAFLAAGPQFTPVVRDDAAFTTTGTYPPQPNHYIYQVPVSESDKLGLHTDNPPGVSSVTTGGMCIRALNQSKVNVTNVHFPAGHVQSSSIIYDFDGIDGKSAACTRTHIWNIADDSLLKASYLAVSGQHPQDAGYVGPSGNWYLASSVPSGTPDTSSLSVLDYYGNDGKNQNIFGASAIKNFGAFRLYFSVDPVANYLVDPSAVLSGYVPQVYAQGYQFSGSLSAPGNVSAEYTKTLFSPTHYTVSNVGFYYASSMVHSPRTIKAVMDDSAMNTFANAKHNTVDKSGLANVVARYDSFDEGIGGDSTSDKTSGKGVASVNNFNLRKLN
jgi:hypothetical protein